MKIFLKKHYPFLLILSLAAILRIYLMVHRGSFWFDEVFSLTFSQGPWKETLHYWLLETNPPLHMLLLRCWIWLFGTGTVILRLTSVFFGLGAIAIFYYWLQKKYILENALIATLLFSLADLHIYQSTELRVYSLFCFLTILSFILFEKIITKPKAIYYFFYVLIQTLLLYSHLTALLIPVGQLLAILLDKKNITHWKKIFLSNLTAGFLFSLWFFPAILNKLYADTVSKGWFFSLDHGGNLLFTLLGNFISKDSLPSIATGLSIILLIIIGISVVDYFKNQNAEQSQGIKFYLFYWAITPIIFAAFLGIFEPKFILFSLPAIILLVVNGIQKINNQKTKMSLLIIIASAMFASAITTVWDTQFNYQPIINQIKQFETKNSLILVEPFHATLTYKQLYQGNTPIIGVYPRIDSYSEKERIARFNWQLIGVKRQEFENWITNLTKDTDRLFYIHYTASQGHLTNWLLASGWQQISFDETIGNDDMYVFVYDAPNYLTTSTTSAAKKY